MRDVMIDLETLGTKPGAVILSIGAVAFDPDTGRVGGLGHQFHKIISLPSALKVGLKVEADTVKWWARQSPEAQRTLWAALSNGHDIRATLDNFAGWLKAISDGREVRVWGNGATFDNIILEAAYQACGLERPWGDYADRCFRTLKDSAKHLEPTREGTHHNALDDAVHQAKWACAIIADRSRGDREAEHLRKQLWAIVGGGARGGIPGFVEGLKEAGVQLSGFEAASLDRLMDEHKRQAVAQAATA